LVKKFFSFSKNSLIVIFISLLKSNALFTVDKSQAGEELAAACKNHEKIALEVRQKTFTFFMNYK